MNQTIKILVVENNEIERMVVRVALNQAKVKVELTETVDCQSALSTLKRELFECVFLDYCLPDGDGLQLIQQIRGAGIKVPLVVLTGQADDQIAVELMKAGASDYLSKNRVSPDSLSRCLSNAVRIYRAEQEAEKANEQLLISEERYRLVLEGSNDGIWDWEIDTEKIYGNERLWEMLGLSPETVTITPDLFFCQLCDLKDRGKIDRALNDHLHEEKKFEVEFRLCHSGGEERYCLARGKAQRDGRGRPFRMSGIVTDITERKRAEERSRFFAEAGTLLSATLDCQTTFNKLASLAVPRIADWCIIEQKKYHPCCIAVAHVDPSEEAKVWKLAEYIDDTYGEKWSTGQLDSNFEVTDSLLAQLASSQEHQQLLEQLNIHSYVFVPMQARDRTLGSMLFVWSSSQRRYTIDDLNLAKDLARSAAWAIDNARLIQTLEEREQSLALQNQILGQQNRELESQRQQIQLQNGQLMEAAQLKSEFLATMSHELRTPMNAIIGFSQVLLRQRSQSVSPSQVQIIERILSNGKGLLALINDILDLSQIEAVRLELQRSEFSLVELVATTLDELRSLADENHLALQFVSELKNSLVVNDSRRLRQILVNLVSNAIKFTENGGICVTLREIEQDQIELRVEDTGIGIPVEELEHIFEEFRQVDQTTTRRYSGTGLGLAIVKSLVEIMQGKISIESELGKGSIFRVELPRKLAISNENLAPC